MVVPPEALRSDGLGAGKRGCRETLFLPKQGIILERSMWKSSMHLALEQQSNLERYKTESEGVMTDEKVVAVI